MISSTPRTELIARVTELAARESGGPAIILGSLPPAGHDLDLLVRRPERERLERRLVELGLLRHGRRFVALAPGMAYEVELIAAEGSLPAPALEDLFAAAEPLPSLAPLARPASPHSVLLLARWRDEEGALRPNRRARLERLLAADPTAIVRARDQADRWGAAGALSRLEAELRDGGTGSPLRAQLKRHLRPLARRVRGQRTVLVCFSGIDGSGKSSQARLLHGAMTAIGVEAALIWNDLQGNAALDVIGGPAKAVLRLARHEVGQMAAAPGGAELPGIPPSRARATWSWYVTLANCLQQRAAVARATLDHQVVIFDRGPLDLAVRMEVLYHAGVERQRRLIARAAPLPQLAFHLDIPAELSLARKQDIWSPVELNEHARLYRELAPRFGVRSLDGQRPIEDIAAEVSGAVWRLVR